MKDLTAVIIDDEPYAIGDLAGVLSDIGSFVVLGRFTSVREARVWLQKYRHPVDFIFCDIEMPDCDGLQARVLLEPYALFFVFCTAHEAYSLLAHRVHGDGYLLKPVAEEEVLSLVDRFNKKQGVSNGLALDYLLLDDPAKSADEAHRKLIRVALDNITHLVRSGNYVLANGLPFENQPKDSSGKEPVLKYHTLGIFNGDLKSFTAKYGFIDYLVRLNQSVVLNMNKIDYIQNDRIVMFGQPYMVTNTYRANLKLYMAKYVPNYTI